MTTFVRPSDGALRDGAFLNLNWQNFAAGERVLYELEHGRPEIGTIEAMPSCNRAIVDGASVLIQAVKHRLPATAGAAAEADLVERLTASHALASNRYQQERGAIVKAWKREQRTRREART